MTITLSNDLPAYPTFTEGIRHGPDRGAIDTRPNMNYAEECIAVHSCGTAHEQLQFLQI